MIFAFIGHDLWALLVSVIVIIAKFGFLWKAPKDGEENINKEDDIPPSTSSIDSLDLSAIV